MKLGIILFTVSLILSVILLNPKIKEKTLALFVISHRDVLSQMDMEMEGRKYKIIKLIDGGGIFVEVYKYTDEGTLLVDSKPIPDKKDAFFKFDDNKHNLFLKDINDDGIAEIILPSLDKNMKARLNIFSFDSYTEKLSKVTDR